MTTAVIGTGGIGSAVLPGVIAEIAGPLAGKLVVGPAQARSLTEGVTPP